MRVVLLLLGALVLSCNAAEESSKKVKRGYGLSSGYGGYGGGYGYGGYGGGYGHGGGYGGGYLGSAGVGGFSTGYNVIGYKSHPVTNYVPKAVTNYVPYSQVNYVKDVKKQVIPQVHTALKIKPIVRIIPAPLITKVLQQTVKFVPYPITRYIRTPIYGIRYGGGGGGGGGIEFGESDYKSGDININIDAEGSADSEEDDDDDRR